MPRIPQDELERLKPDIGLAELIRSGGLEPKQKGDGLVGLCPMHEDSSPSLVVTPAKNLWACLGACGTGGSVIDWVMKTQGVSFRHAFEILRHGGPIREAVAVKKSRVRHLPPPVDGAARDAELLLQVVDYYHRTIQEAPDAQAYLKKRGIDSPEAVAAFKLGYANRTLGIRLPTKRRAEGLRIRHRLKGLGIFRSSGHEHLTGCLVFSVFDERGEIGGIYGRKIRPDRNPGAILHLYLPGPHRGVFRPCQA